MLGLADYDSDDDDAEGGAEEAEVVAPPKPVATTKSISAKFGRRGKRYLAAAALLPPEIRAALEGGGGVDDDDAGQRDLSARAEVKTRVKKPDGKQHGLLAMLPACEHVLATPPPVVEAPDDSTRKDDSEEESEEEEDDGAAPASFFSLPAKKQGALAGPSLPTKKRVVDAAPATRQLLEQHVVQVERDPDVFYEQEFELTSAAAAKRKRRHMDRALMEGDMGAVEGAAGVELLHCDRPLELRSAAELIRAKDEQQAREVKINAGFYNAATGETTNSSKASKNQKRKHQINSLAIAAAEREIDMLEKKGGSLKTKRETQARYGW